VFLGMLKNDKKNDEGLGATMIRLAFAKNVYRYPKEKRP
jgi:hypothetical protein